ncbi:MAG TPA: hypothetical protein VNX29_01280 [Kaistia sp.]|nr:hypothetical protein [Kaistia sp.]
MSIPSITIRLDFADSGVSGGLSVQGAAPSPTSLGTGFAEGGVSDGGPPTPFANAAAVATGHDSVAPTPLSDIGATIATATGSAAPEPSPDLAGVAQVSGTTDEPRPEREPGALSKQPSSKR